MGEGELAGELLDPPHLTCGHPVARERWNRQLLAAAAAATTTLWTYSAVFGACLQYLRCQYHNELPYLRCRAGVQACLEDTPVAPAPVVEREGRLLAAAWHERLISVGRHQDSLGELWLLQQMLYNQNNLQLRVVVPYIYLSPYYCCAYLALLSY